MGATSPNEAKARNESWRSHWGTEPRGAGRPSCDLYENRRDLHAVFTGGRVTTMVVAPVSAYAIPGNQTQTRPVWPPPGLSSTRTRAAQQKDRACGPLV